MTELSPVDTVKRVLDYHQRTKHHLHRYAHSLGYLDWAQQPTPFRLYQGAPLIPLMHPPVDKRPYYDELFEAGAIPAAPLELENLSRLFCDSLAISAWKQVQGAPPWSLRVNPSSGDLHPTEAYLVCGSVAGLREPGVFHYGVFNHALERRYVLTEPEWGRVAAQLPPGAILIALSSIYWREAWKYGERAFRYCHHDVGHAIAAIIFAAATFGWEGRLIENIGDEDLESLLGLRSQVGPEAEEAECLIALFPDGALGDSDGVVLELPSDLLARLRATEAMGRPNTLSAAHHPWPIIDEVAALTRHPRMENKKKQMPCEGLETRASVLGQRPVSARPIIRARRSAVRMDGRTGMAEEVFYHMMARTLPAARPFRVLPWPPHVSLALFVHRVCGLALGLYVLARSPEHWALLRAATREDFSWQRPERCPSWLNLFQLLAGDARPAAEIISCHQSIAADGAFSLGMLADFDAMTQSPWVYPRLFWEAGVIGQVLYLEAEAADLRATGIGCFFDDTMHELLGLTDERWQSLYHFTIGGAIWDERLQTLPAYHHLAGDARWSGT
ncbi:MAG: SagB/ThcOx family dehydrogenase [Gammaproteobacteria bacterium]